MNLAQIENLIKVDIRWAIKHGPGWNPGYGAVYNVESGRWTNNKEPAFRNGKEIQKPCGVCAIGAICVRRQPPAAESTVGYSYTNSSDVASAAKILGKDESWVDNLYLAVADIGELRRDTSREARANDLIKIYAYSKSAVDMAVRLVEYAESYKARVRKARRAKN